MKDKSNKKLLGAGIFAAIAASLCCIAPLLALIAGVSGFASAFTWLEPLRPYLIVLTVVTLGYAWYQKLKSKEEIECDCETDEKPSFLQSKKILGIVTVFAILMLAFPYYNSAVFSSKQDMSEVQQVELTTVNLQVSGMTCQGCEVNVTNYAEAAGSESVEANYTTGKTTIKYDKSITNIDSIVTSIETLGYKVDVN